MGVLIEEGDPDLTSVVSVVIGMSLGDEKKTRESPINIKQKILDNIVKIITRPDEGTEGYNRAETVVNL